MEPAADGLEGVRQALKRLEIRFDCLSGRLAELAEENAALRECLELSGTTPAEAFAARLHRHRFARVLQQHPLRRPAAQACSSCLTELSRAHELLFLVLGLAGPGSACPVAAASRAVAGSVEKVSPELSRHFPLSIYAVGGAGGGRGPLPSVERLTLPLAGAGEAAVSPLAAPPLAAPRAVCAVVAAAGLVYAIAGRGADGAALSSVEIYDPRLDSWSEAPSLLRARGWVAAARIGCGVCVVGGEGDDLTFDVAEKLDLGECSWSPLPPMRCPRWAAAAASAGGHVYVAGGHHDDGEVLGDFERLSFLPGGARDWEQLAPLRCPRAALGLAALGGSLYAVGGYDEQERGLRVLERYNPAGPGEWEALAPMAAPRWGLGAVGCGGRLYVLGGTAGNGLVNVGVVKRYCPETDAWESVGRLRTARRCCGVAACR
uniref:Uncharacterized protein n=1 Tax=Alexandrium monilatum TaxID=311494 RepID=A0A7S4RLS8_9DINO